MGERAESCERGPGARPGPSHPRVGGWDKTRSAEVFWQSECELLKKYRSASDNKLGDANIVQGWQPARKYCVSCPCAFYGHNMGPPLLSNV